MATRTVEAWVLCIEENERPFAPTFLQLDWRFRGAISRARKMGAISEKSGEISLLPCTRPVSDLGRETFRILTLGVKDRKNVSPSEIQKLTQNLIGLKLKKVGLSASDFGWDLDETKRHFHKTGVELCVTE